MESLHCGIDFGTTNTSAALCDGKTVRVLPLDPANDLPSSLPSLLYLTRDQEPIVGRRAADTFIERNVDREVVLELVDLGVDIEAYVASEPDKSESYRPSARDHDMREAVRAHALQEVNSPGRLFQSLKTLLRHREFTTTEVFGSLYQIEELVSLVLKPVKAAVDAAAGGDVSRAVFGRPVRFSLDDGEDRLAEERLRTAAHIAGFREVVFFYEPVGACVEYAVAVPEERRLMVVDIGGGTCDVCVMQFGASGGTAERLADSRILGVAGVPVAGDAIDREIIRGKMFPRFGKNARYGPSRLPMPQYLYNNILDWQNLYKLNTEEIIHWLIAAEADCDQPRALRALRHLIQHNLGYPVAREVEAAKKRLSETEETSISLHHGDIQIEERLERQEFAHIIEEQLEAMTESLTAAESAAGVRPEDLDLVLTTGGTSLIPAVRALLEDRYGAGRLHRRDTFTSVASGLAIVSRHL